MPFAGTFLRKQARVEAFLRGQRISQMKPGNNNEVDLLLRAFARRRHESASQSGLASGDGKPLSTDHLDADELNSYAEDVAPAAARERYTEHLADCEACRSIVISLSQAAGGANRYEVPERQRGSSFWQTLTALLTPAVLRYAVPALVLTAVLGIGFLALRQQRRNDFVAQVQPENSQSPQNKAGSDSRSEPSATIQNETRSTTNTASTTELNTLKDKKTQVSQAPLSSSEPTMAKAPLAKDAGQPGEGAGGAESRPSYAPEPKAAAPPPPAPLLEAEKSADLAKERPAKREDQDRARDEYRNQASDDVHGPNRSAAQRNSTALPANGRVGGLMGARGPSGDKNKKGAEVETRSLSGRHFTRQGDAWVDTAYESSRATTKVTRGSDQYRALVADEPGIRTIADQLNGVVIVVWKNRAYRIQ
jgi:hypothetical protein